MSKARWVAGHPYARPRAGSAGRVNAPITGCKDPKDIDARADLISKQVAKLVAAGRSDMARGIAADLGAARSKREVEKILLAVDDIVAHSAPIKAQSITFKELGQSWTNGELTRRYPDYIREKKTAKRDKELLEKYVYPHIGDMPVRAIQLIDGQTVMARIPAKDEKLGRPIAPATRRHVAQVMSRLMNLAYQPLNIITTSPFQRGFLPRIGSSKAKQYIYPDEDAKLLACAQVPLVWRLFYGVDDREGFRFSELRLLEWSDLDLDRGVVRLDVNKTDEPRAWALDAGVVRALKRWKEMRPSLQRPFVNIPNDTHQADLFREHLKLAGVTREALFESTAQHTRIRVHDLRATFVTISLAIGKSESWVSDRTGHKSSTMIFRYRRAARTLEELGLGGLKPLDLALNWAEDRGANGGPIDGPKRRGRSQKHLVPKEGLEPSRPFGRRILKPQFQNRDAPVGPENDGSGDQSVPGGPNWPTRWPTEASSSNEADASKEASRQSEIAARLRSGLQLAKAGLEAESDANLRELARLVGGGP